MGQRLNIEIWNNGKVLANAYYHWSGYTSASAKLTKTILEFFHFNEPYESKLLYAIRALESTGAKLTEEDIRVAERNPEFLDCTFLCAIDRNYGLIGITDYSIESTRDYEDGRVTLYLDEQRINFDVFARMPACEWEKEEHECNDNPDANYKELPSLAVTFSDIKFENFCDVAEKYLLHNEGKPFTTRNDPYNVYIPIE